MTATGQQKPEKSPVKVFQHSEDPDPQPGSLVISTQNNTCELDVIDEAHMADELDLYDKDDSFIFQNHVSKKPSDAIRKLYGSNYCFAFVDELVQTVEEIYVTPEKCTTVTIDFPVDRETKIQRLLNNILKKLDKRTQSIEFPGVLKEV